MASTTKQQHYRRLMKEKKTSVDQSKVDHPLAKYNSLGQLLCVICNQQVKSNILWTSHLKSRRHKDSVASLKASQKGAAPPVTSCPPSEVVATPSPTSRSNGSPPGKVRVHEEASVAGGASARKRNLEEEEPQISSAPKKKKSKHRGESSNPTPSGLPADFFDSGVKKKFYPKGEEPVYEASDEEVDLPMVVEEEKGGGPKVDIDKIVPAPPSNLPADFFDSARGQEDSAQDESKPREEPKGSLPEGFFDDPKKDAKARKVEYKDPMTEEWEKFQKSIQKEDDISEALLIEGDEEAMDERELDEVNEQVRCFTKAEELRQKHEQFVTKQKTREETNEGTNKEGEKTDSMSDSDDDEDFDEFLDWREKVS